MKKRVIAFFSVLIVVFVCGIFVGYYSKPYTNDINVETIVGDNIGSTITIDTVMFVSDIEEPPFDFAEYPYSISDAGKQHIKEYESLRLERYWIGKNPRPSIGYGHQILDNENYVTITEKQANEIFEEDIKKVNASINRLLGKVNKNFKFSQGFIDGLGSLIYNCGEYGISTTVFFDRLKKCREDENTIHNINQSDLNFTLAAVKTTRITYEGHKKRRIAEYNMMVQ